MYCRCIDNNVTCVTPHCVLVYVLPTFITYDVIHYNCVAIVAVIDYMFKLVFIVHVLCGHECITYTACGIMHLICCYYKYMYLIHASTCIIVSLLLCQ